MKKSIPLKLIIKTKKWLKKNGHDFFKGIKDKYGRVDAVWSEGGIPHPVHFREGMQVRNFMRKSKLCMDWTDHDFDDNWVELIEEAIKEPYLLNRTERAKLALKIVDEIHSLYLSNAGGLGLSEELKKIMDFWALNTQKPFNEEDYYRKTEKLIAHLRKKPQPWDQQ